MSHDHYTIYTGASSFAVSNSAQISPNL